MELTNLSQTISELHVVTIVWFTLALTVARLAFVKMPDQGARTLVEVIEAALIAGVLVFLVIQPFVVKAFFIPSGSMRPTLLVDDHILVNRFLYRFKQPEHEDVVVFNAPPEATVQTNEIDTSDEPVDYIKRLIGLPGDTIQVFGGSITVNGTIYHHDDVRPYFNLSKDDPTSKDEDHLKFIDGGVSVFHGSAWTTYTAAEVAQRLNGSPSASITISPGYVERNGQKLVEPYISEDPDYDLKLAPNGDVILTDPYEGVHINGQTPDPDDVSQLEDDEKSPPGKVAPGEVIVMGDNRNDSNDSSRWGPLSESRLVGRAVFIFYPFNRIQPIR